MMVTAVLKLHLVHEAYSMGPEFMDRGRLAKTHRKNLSTSETGVCAEKEKGRLDKEDICRVARSVPAALLSPPHRNHTMH